jgi:flagellar biosynthetic protein FliQ
MAGEIEATPMISDALVILGASMMALVGDFTQDIFAEIARMGG